MKARYVIAVLLCALSPLSLSAADNSNLNARIKDATDVIRQIMMTPDKSIPNSIARQATCVGVIPSVKKAAFIVGGSYGQGVVTCRTRKGWSAPVFIRLAGGSVGFQIGGQATDLVLVAVNDKGFQDLLRSKFKIGADAAAAAGPVGRNTAAATDLRLNAELLTYSRSKGLFAGIDLNGAVVSQNNDDTNAFYGGTVENFDKVLHGSVPVPAAAQPFVRAIGKYFVAAHAN
ncbi:lipid-binding SYLF domain-containing protein [Granulicella mallensis]|uniref:Ysc84 actin-binding domain-containing protein n=1 Tax=Granulicella mallensis (strain ATCC BAA-1857 / DSM 23137 / MP5ACTX8) TaxID=682795 RepID=G8P144_GRAMM|nr:lipid-binding SYLF domain-containing protein [Granulicella mallensis]AEU36968.1 hypothetical protein AciX8_2658 [Granulicella mallensis MP5ACTX8]